MGLNHLKRDFAATESIRGEIRIAEFGRAGTFRSLRPDFFQDALTHYLILDETGRIRLFLYSFGQSLMKNQDKKRILIFDFDPAAASRMAGIIKDLGYEPILGDFRRLISDTILYEPALVIVDEWISTLRGVENYAMFNLNWHTCHVPVLTISSTLQEDILLTPETGCGKIGKPLRLEYFEQAVSSLAA